MVAVRIACYIRAVPPVHDFSLLASPFKSRPRKRIEAVYTFFVYIVFIVTYVRGCLTVGTLDTLAFLSLYIPGLFCSYSFYY